MDTFYKKVTENERLHFDQELQSLYSQGTALQHELHITKDKLQKQDKELEEYFKAMPINQHMSNIEVGANDRPEYQTTKRVPTGQLISIEDENDNTVKGENSKSEGKKRCHVSEKLIDGNDMEGVTLTANGNNISMHKKNFTNTRTRFYAKININTQKLSKEEIENEIRKIFNKDRFMIDISNKNSNRYMYVMFATGEERTRLTNSETIINNVGKFYTDKEKEVTISDPLKCEIKNILIDKSNSEVSVVLNNYGLGNLNRVFNNTKKSKDGSKRYEKSRLYPKFNGNTETGKEEIYGPADRRRSGSRLQRHIRDSKQHIMMMDTNIDEQTMTMIEEEKTGSIMDIDIESTSRTISIHEEETWDKEYNSNINEMSDCDRVKTKLKIIKEIEQCWKKWNKLTMEKNESNVKTRWNLDMMENFGARERKVITKYKILVHRFNDICNMKMTTEAFKQNITLHDNLEDSTSINIAKIKLEKEKTTTISGRWEKDNEDVKYIKPYMTLENIDKRNVSVQRTSNINKENLIINNMVIDKDKNELRANAKLWLNNVIEETGIYENLNNFIDRDFFDFTNKEIFLQIGAIIQKETTEFIKRIAVARQRSTNLILILAFDKSADDHKVTNKFY
ncbi:17588_t:CDS:2 [Rhizophagus irregularis]|nr:17588_t:CDS:2 [Rhizophagus irregularis]